MCLKSSQVKPASVNSTSLLDMSFLQPCPLLEFLWGETAYKDVKPDME